MLKYKLVPCVLMLPTVEQGLVSKPYLTQFTEISKYFVGICDLQDTVEVQLLQESLVDLREQGNMFVPCRSEEIKSRFSKA